MQWEYSSILEQYIKELAQEKRYSDAISYCRLWNSLDPFDERTHRELMILYSRTSQNYKMVEQFEKCRKLLAEEVGESPEEETQLLYVELRNREVNHVSHQSIPTFKSELIGRQRELEELEKLITDKETFLISLVGIGGTGKTLLSLHIAERTQHNFSQGVLFIDLSGVKNSNDAISLISRQLEIIDNRTTRETPIMFLKHYLQSTDMLLILDNFEQLEGGDNLIKEILSSGQKFKILITSRIPLSIEEECIYSVPPLRFPDLDNSIKSTEDLLQYEAVAFFPSTARETIFLWIISHSSPEPFGASIFESLWNCSFKTIKSAGAAKNYEEYN